MKENRIGIIVSGIVAILSLIGSILFSIFKLNWGENFSFAIMGSAWLSFIVCLINYIVLRKKMIEDLVNGIYRYNNDSMAQLYTLSKNVEVENLSIVVGIACSHLNNLIFLAYNIKVGLFKVEKNKRNLLDQIINNLEGEIQFEFNSIGQYLERRPKKAEKIKKYLYKIIYKLLDNNVAYDLAFNLAKTVKTDGKTVEETYEMTKQEFEKDACDLLEKEIKVMQLKDDIKSKKQKLKKLKDD